MAAAAAEQSGRRGRSWAGALLSWGARLTLLAVALPFAALTAPLWLPLAGVAVVAGALLGAARLGVGAAGAVLRAAGGAVRGLASVREGGWRGGGRGGGGGGEG
jgi:hypothetical protein